MRDPSVTPIGTKEWRDENGRLHRDDGPAVEFPGGGTMWYRHGALHRDGGPAVEDPDGTRWWYRDNLTHRDDGPAVEWSFGLKEWFRDGQRHREDGPAIEHADGAVEWWIDGRQLSSAEITAVQRTLQEKSQERLANQQQQQSAAQIQENLRRKAGHTKIGPPNKKLP